MRGAAEALQLLGAHPLVRKFATYFVAGGACALLDIALFSAFLFLAELHYLIAATISFLFTTALNYVLSVRYVFGRGRRSRPQAVFLVYLVSLIGIALHLLTLTISVELLELHPLIGKIVGLAIGFVWNFLSRYFWVFAR